MGRRRRRKPSYDPELDKLQVTFRWPRIPDGTRLHVCENRLGKWEWGYYVGEVVKSTGSRVWIRWAAEDPWIEERSTEQLEYLRQRGLLRIIALRKQNRHRSDDS